MVVQILQRSLLRFLLFWITLMGGIACQVQALTLKEAISYALKENTELAILKEENDLQWNEIRILKQKFLPQLSFNLSASLQHEVYFDEIFEQKKIHAYPSLKLLTPIGTQLEVFTEQNLGQEQGQAKAGAALRVVLEQPLLKGRKTITHTWTIENAHYNRQIKALLLKQKTEQIIYQVISSYYAILLCQENIDMQNRWLTQAKLFYEHLNQKVLAGRAAQNDLDAAQLQVKQALNYLAQSEFEYQQAKHALQQLIGEGTLIEDLQMLNKEYIHADFVNAGLYQQLCNHDLEAILYQINRLKAQNQLALAKDATLIDLRLRGDWTSGRYHIYGKNSDDPLSDETIFGFPFIHENGNYTAQLVLNVPLSSRKELKHQIHVQRFELKKLDLEFQRHQKQLKHFANNLIDTMTLKNQQLELSRDAFELAQKNHDNALKKLEAGRTSVFEVVLIREKLHEAQKNYHANLIGFYDALANIELNAGQLSDKWLKD